MPARTLPPPRKGEKAIHRERFTDPERQLLADYREGATEYNSGNVLVIGDTHLPFERPGYFDFLRRTRDKFKCERVVHIGDVVDNHYSSYHETDPDGLSAGDELERAKRALVKYVDEFPEVTVCIGNHDRLIMRKAQTAGLSRHWIRDYAEVLGCPGWEFVEDVTIDSVLYRHGEGGKAIKIMEKQGTSVVQGHLHSDFYVQWHVTNHFRHFAMQVGCGVNQNSYAMAYAKSFPSRFVMGCGVVQEYGTLPITVPMPL